MVAVALRHGPAGAAGGPPARAGRVRRDGPLAAPCLRDIRFAEQETIVERDLVVSHVTMHGRQTGPLVLQDGRAIRVLPPTGRRIPFEQVHVSRVDADGRALTHLAVRDDLGLLLQLGHLPLGPAPLWRQLVWALSGRTAAARRTFLADRPRPAVRSTDDPAPQPG